VATYSSAITRAHSWTDNDTVQHTYQRANASADLVTDKLSNSSTVTCSVSFSNQSTNQ
jgi:hypothetical protein